MKPCSEPQSSLHWPRSWPGSQLLAVPAARRPGTQSYLSSTAGTYKEWITSTAVDVTSVPLVSGTESVAQTSSPQTDPSATDEQLATSRPLAVQYHWTARRSVATAPAPLEHDEERSRQTKRIAKRRTHQAEIASTAEDENLVLCGASVGNVSTARTDRTIAVRLVCSTSRPTRRDRTDFFDMNNSIYVDVHRDSSTRTYGHPREG